MKKLIFVLSIMVVGLSVSAQEYTGKDVTVTLENTTGKYIAYGKVRFHHGNIITYGRHGERAEQDGGYTDKEFKDLDAVFKPTISFDKVKNVRYVSLYAYPKRQVFDISGEARGANDHKAIKTSSHLLMKLEGTYERPSATIYTK